MPVERFELPLNRDGWTTQIDDLNLGDAIRFASPMGLPFAGVYRGIKQYKLGSVLIAAVDGRGQLEFPIDDVCRLERTH